MKPSSPLALPLYVVLLWLTALGACSWAARRWLAPMAARQEAAARASPGSAAVLSAGGACVPSPREAPLQEPRAAAPLLLSAAR